MWINTFFIAFCLFFNVVCFQEATNNNEAVSDNPLENNAPTDKNVHTDIDTRGDIIITSEPVSVIDEVALNVTDLHVTEEISTTTIEEALTTISEAGFTQEEILPSPCDSNPCKNGGVCLVDAISTVLYSCKCPKNFTGTHCQVADSCAVDGNGNLCRKGACTYQEDGLVRSCKCFFGMFWNEVEKECQESVPPCTPNPCINGGTCSSGADDQFRCDCRSGYEGATCAVENWCMEGDVCENGRCNLDAKGARKTCVCDPGFYWNESSWECEDPQPPCIPNPCKNNGTCTTIGNNTNTFSCTCTRGFTGDTCGVHDMCTPYGKEENTCENGVCEVYEKSRKCSCNSGFYLDGMTQTCKEIINPCVPNPCHHDGICTPLLQEDFNCTCSDGYAGKQCLELDYCILDGGDAFCGNAECWDDPQQKLYYCSCDESQYFDYVLRTCVDVDFCPLIKCRQNEMCKKSTCICDEDFERSNTTGKCEPKLCTSDACPVKDLICTQNSDSSEYKCSCEKGYAFNGTHCNAGADCIFPNLNPCSQVCATNEKKTVCSCVEEFFEMSDDNKTCTPLNANLTCTMKTCSKGNCVVQGDSEKCICPPGYTEINSECIDLCSAGKLPKGFCPNDQCEATGAGFRCKCERKYMLSDDRTTCTARQVCERDEIGWLVCSSLNAECFEDWNTEEGYRCVCLDHQIRSPSGSCHDACNDPENQKMCSDLNALCDISTGETSCKCSPYFQPFKNGSKCSKKASDSYTLTLPLNSETYQQERQVFARPYVENEINLVKVQKDVTSTIKSLFPGLISTNILNCRENKNYILCKIEMQFSSVSKEELTRLKLSENCLKVKDSISKCIFPPSLVLQRMFVDEVVSYKQSNPCDADMKDHLCGSDTVCVSSTSDRTFNCSCRDGFAAQHRVFPFADTQSYIESCIDIDECLDRFACPKHMVCRNTLGSYTCSCKARYMFKDTANPNGGCIEICNPNPCLNGECSSAGDHDFECSCEPGYRGILCNLRDEHFKKAWTNTVVVGAVLGGTLLVTLIISIVYTSRLKKRKYSDGPDRMLYGTEMTERRNVETGTINNAFQK